MPTITIHLTQEQLQTLVKEQEVDIDLPIDNIGRASNRQILSVQTFIELFKEQIVRLRLSGNLRTLETYQAAYRKFSAFLGERDLCSAPITSDLMESYQANLRRCDLSLNTVSFYMRILRAVYHKAVDKGLTIDHHPFRHVYTGMAKTSKRAITLEEIRRIKQLDIHSERLLFARDIFLLSFYTRGMAFVDMAYLKKSDLKDGILTYKRKKTGQQLHVRWEKEMQEIVDLYPSKTGKYLLPLIHTLNGKERNQYRNHQTKINEDLKKIAQLAGISQKLTMYCARHSWATIARQMNIPVEVISRGMGHTNERTTEIYLRSIDVKTLDQANHQILESLQ